MSENAGDQSLHGLQDLAAARSAMASDGHRLSSCSGDGDDAEEDDLFQVHASALGADAEAMTAAALRPGQAESVAAAPVSGISSLLSLQHGLSRQQPMQESSPGFW